MPRLVSFLGLLVFVGLAYVFSKDRKNVRWHTVTPRPGPSCRGEE